MRNSMVILGACLVLALGITGCDDDEFLDQTISFDQQVALAAQGVTTAISAVTVLATVLIPKLSSSASGPSCVDADICDGGGSAQLCNGVEVNLFDCEVTDVGRLNGIPAATLAGRSVELNLTIDDDTLLSGVLILSSFSVEPQCFQLNYNINVMVVNGVSSSVSGDLLQCTDGNVTGSLSVQVADPGIDLSFLFQGDFALIGVFEPGSKTQIDEFCFDLTAQDITDIQNCQQ